MTTTGGWIGVDLDGTLAHYTEWGDGSVGDPIALMVKRVKKWLSEGREVRIVTARCSGQDAAQQQHLIESWCVKHLGVKLLCTAAKDFKMIELWDDRAVRVEKNTGRRIR